jgi:serine/threonine protein kinase
VYKAEIKERFRMEGDPQFVALKYIDAKFQGNVLSESIFLKKSNCPYIVNCYHTFLSDDGENIIISLELCKGTLKEEVSKLKGDMPRIMKLFVQCLKGLDYIHKK